MNKRQRELAEYIEKELGKRYPEWGVEVSENMFGARWAVIFIEKTDDWCHSVGWFDFDKLSSRDDASYIIGEVISKMSDSKSASGMTISE